MLIGRSQLLSKGIFRRFGCVGSKGRNRCNQKPWIELLDTRSVDQTSFHLLSGRQSGAGTEGLTVEQLVMQFHELLNGHWRLTGNLSDNLVFTLKNPMLVVLSDLDQVLSEERR